MSQAILVLLALGLEPKDRVRDELCASGDGLDLGCPW